MSDPRNRKSPKRASEAPVDWGERLKASMNEASADTSPSIPDEDDDLRALLMAQLDKTRAAAAETSAPPISDASALEENPEVIEGPVIIEETDRIKEPDDAEKPEVVDIPETVKEPETLSSPAVTFVPDGHVPGVSNRPPDSVVEIAPLPSRITADVFLNNPSVDGRVDDGRLRRLAEENAALLREIDETPPLLTDTDGIPLDEDMMDESVMDVEDQLSENDAVFSESERKSDRRAEPTSARVLVSHDPLQIGLESSQSACHVLDSELAVGASLARQSKSRVGTEPCPAQGADLHTVHVQPRPHALRRTADPAPDYTQAMPPTDPESVETRDTELYVHLGYEGSLSHAEDHARIRTVQSAEECGESPESLSRSAAAYEASVMEEMQITARRIHRERRATRARFVLTLVSAWLALLYDVLPSILSDIGAPTAFVEGAWYPLIGLLLTVAIAFPFGRRLGRGALGLAAFAPTADSVAGIALLANAVYTVTAAIAVFVNQPPLPLFTGVALTVLAVSALVEWLRVEGEVLAHTVVSSGKEAYLLTSGRTPASSACYAEAGEQPRDVFTTVKAHHLGRFDETAARYSPYTGRLHYLLLAALPVAVLCAVLTVSRGGGVLADGVRMLVVALLCCLPAAYPLAVSLPLFRANSILARKGCAVVGGDAPAAYEVKDDGRIFFGGRDVLFAAHRQEVLLRPESPADTAEDWRRITNRLFHLIDSPLARDLPLEDDGSVFALEKLHVELVEADVGYRRLFYTDSSPDRPRTFEIEMGSYEALTRRGINLTKPAMERTYRRRENCHVLYVAFDGYLRVAYGTEYRPNRSFVHTRRLLLAEGYTPVLVTCDPMVTSELLGEPRFKSLSGMECVRPRTAEIPRRVRTSGVIATGGAQDLLYPLAACRRMRCAYHLAYAVAWGGVVLNAGILLAAVLLGVTELLTSPILSVLHLLVCGIIGAVSASVISRAGLCMSRQPKHRPPKRASRKAATTSNNAEATSPSSDHL